MFQDLLNFDRNLLISSQGIVPPENAHILIYLAETIVIWGMIVLVWLWLYGVYRKNDMTKIQALKIFGLIASVFIIYGIINFWIPKWRPHPWEVIPHAIKPLIPHPLDNSFPSGHALFFGALAVWVWSFTKNKILLAITILFGVITVICRVLGGVHYPGDILGGIFFGCLGAYLFRDFVSSLIEKIAPYILRIARYIKL